MFDDPCIQSKEMGVRQGLEHQFVIGLGGMWEELARMDLLLARGQASGHSLSMTGCDVLQKGRISRQLPRQRYTTLLQYVQDVQLQETYGEPYFLKDIGYMFVCE